MALKRPARKTYDTPPPGEIEISVKGQIWKVLDASDAELKEILAADIDAALIKNAASAVLFARKSGKWDVVEQMLSRLIGRPKESLEVSAPTPVIIRRRNGEEIELSAKEGEKQ